MKKTALIGALTLAATGAAHAQLQLYGLVDGSYGKNIVDAQEGTKARANFHSGGDSGSGQGNSTTRVGIKGSTDVGSGIKANFKFETGGITSNGDVNPTGTGETGTFFARQAWFGLSGGFGEFRFGKQDSVPFQTFIDYDYNGASNGVSAAGYSGAGRWLQGRQSRSLQYISPVFAGVKGQLGLRLKDDTPGAKDVVSGGVTYTLAGLSVSGGFQTKAAEGGNNYFGVAAGYDFGVAKVTLGYHDEKTDKGVIVGAQATLAGVNFGGIYAVKTKDAADSKGSVLELFANKEVLKNTYAYAEIGVADKKVAGGKGTGYAIGMIYTF